MQTARQNLFQNAPCIRKSLETEFAVTFADAAVVDSAERQIMLEKMDIVVVDASPARSCVFDYFVDVIGVRAINVKCERFFVLLDKLNRLAQIFV